MTTPTGVPPALDFADPELLFEAGQTEAALEAWLRIATDRPDEIRPRARIAACLNRLGRFDEAVAVLEPLAAATPDQPQVQYRLAVARAGLGRDAAALDALEAAAAAGVRAASGIDEERAFDHLRGTPRFAAARARIAVNDAPTAHDPRFRTFDFWVGDWEARSEDGMLQGHSTIEIVLDGAAIIERWSGASGVRGTSLNRYDRRIDRWRQTWVDDQGDAIEFEDGRASGGAGARSVAFRARDDDGGLRRLTFTELGPDAFHQLAERSADGGASWMVEYDFRYRRMTRPGG